MYANKPHRGHKMDIMEIKAKHAASHTAGESKKPIKRSADIGVGRQNYPGTQSGGRNR